MERHYQKEIFRSLRKPDAYPHPTAAIQTRETHISKVFLTGEYVYKIKKPVDFGFLDFTTLARRQYYCRLEVTLNRRLAKGVYLDVVPITRRGGRYVLAGMGRPVEYAVRMHQLPEDRTLKRLLRRGKIDAAALERLARKLAEFYRHAAAGDRIDAIGSWSTVRRNCEENFRQTAPYVGRIIDPRMFEIVRAATRAFLRHRQALFLHRTNAGKIRDCHGDLKAGHIYLSDGIQVIDCIEFNERFRYADITSDLACLAVDLDFEGYPKTGLDLITCFGRHSKDRDLFVLMDFYKCYRAVVKVKVNCLRQAEGNLAEYARNRLFRETRRYMELAYRYAQKITRPTLWVFCGLPAAGKSTLAAALAGVLGIRVLQSDTIRKHLFGLTPQQTVDLPYGRGIYTRRAGALTYGKLLLAAQAELRRGRSVILDATFSRRRDRREAVRLARSMDAGHILVECTAPAGVIKKRLAARQHQSPVSDARRHHFNAFQSRFEPLQPEDSRSLVRIDTQKPVAENMQRVLAFHYAAPAG